MADGFDLLADETRASIVRELAVARREDPQNQAVPFAELRKRVGATDSGRFNYHLGKIRGHFVEAVDDGYRLSVVGMRAAAAVLGGEFGDQPSRDPVTLEERCLRCGNDLVARYEDGLLQVGCGNHHGFADSVPPAMVEDRSLREAVSVFDTKLRREVGMARDGACPLCQGELSWSVIREPDEAPVDFVYAAECERCGHHLGVLPGLLVLDHPAVVAAYRDAGIDVREEHLWTIDCCVPGAADIEQTDPFHVSIEAGPTDDQRFLLDDTGCIVEEP
jgi:hypothetical protein